MTAEPWAWHAHPDVWLLVAVLAVGYGVALRRLGPKHAPSGVPVVTRWQVASFATGVFAIWLGADWPLSDIAEHYLFSVHMTQHTLFSLVAPPLLLAGTPMWLARVLLHRSRIVFAVVRFASRPLVALVVFNTVIVVSHWPVMVNFALRHELAHLGMHTVLVATAFAMWMPVLSPLPDIPRLGPPAQMLYLFVQSLVPTVPASFLTFSTGTIYSFYASVPRLWGMSVVQDQQVAGLIMKLGGAAILWTLITVVFYRWQAKEEREERLVQRMVHDTVPGLGLEHSSVNGAP